MGVQIDFRKTDYDQLLEFMVGGQVMSPTFEAAKAEIQRRNMEAQTKATQALVTSTDDLLKATKSLDRLTKLLVALTIIVAFLAAIPLLKSERHPSDLTKEGSPR